jgi:AcrR family transcriptional regulator
MTHGIGDLALRPLAKALKTNARMLIYHFGSREELLREILAGLRDRESGRVAQCSSPAASRARCRTSCAGIGGG